MSNAKVHDNTFPTTLSLPEILGFRIVGLSHRIQLFFHSRVVWVALKSMIIGSHKYRGCFIVLSRHSVAQLLLHSGQYNVIQDILQAEYVWIQVQSMNKNCKFERKCLKSTECKLFQDNGQQSVDTSHTTTNVDCEHRRYYVD